MRKILLTAFIVGWSMLGIGQTLPKDTMHYDDFIRRVVMHHPSVFLAENTVKLGALEVLHSRGGFDPKLGSDMNAKTYDGKQYYNQLDAGLKIPTWFGLTLQSGYSQNEGVYLNPQENLPDAGLWYAGVKLELGNGLIIDKRRAELKKAKLYKEATEIQKRFILNELIYRASLAYWDWQQSVQQLEVYEQTLNNAVTRYYGVVETVRQGNRPAMDTLESKIQMQNRRIAYNNAVLKANNAGLQLEMFLWKDGYIPLELEAEAVPSTQVTWNLPLQFSATDSFVTNHPQIQLTNLKLDQLEVELQLKKEMLKPTVSVKYNILTEPISTTGLAPVSTSNVAWGGTISYPIFTRKERAEVRMSKLEIDNLILERSQKQAEIKYKTNALWNKLLTLETQLPMYQQNAIDYAMLYAGERRLFESGESTIFMINSREKAMLDAELKAIEMQTTVQRIRNEIMYMFMVDVSY